MGGGENVEGPFVEQHFPVLRVDGFPILIERMGFFGGQVHSFVKPEGLFHIVHSLHQPRIIDRSDMALQKPHEVEFEVQIGLYTCGRAKDELALIPPVSGGN